MPLLPSLPRRLSFTHVCKTCALANTSTHIHTYHKRQNATVTEIFFAHCWQTSCWVTDTYPSLVISQLVSQSSSWSPWNKLWIEIRSLSPITPALLIRAVLNCEIIQTNLWAIVQKELLKTTENYKPDSATTASK